MNERIAAIRAYLLKSTLPAAVILLSAVAPLYSQSDTVSGLVIAVDGTPMAGVPVKATPEGTNSAVLPTITTHTDSAGQYHFDGVPSGSYLLRAGPDGGNDVSILSRLAMSFSLMMDDLAADPITGKRTPATSRTRFIPILAGPARLMVPDIWNNNFNIVMSPSAVTVSGHLIIPTGTTLPPLTANLAETRSQLSINTEIHTDGTFEIPNVPPGTYILRTIPNLGIQPEIVTVTNQDRKGIELGGKTSGVRVTGNVRPSDQPVYQNMFPEWVYLVGKDASEVSPSQSISFLGTTLLLNSEPSQPKPPPPIVFSNATGAAIEASFAPVGPDGRFEFLTVPPGEYYLRTVPEMGVPNFPLTVAGDKDIDNLHVGDGVRVRGEVVSLNLGTRPPELIRLTAAGFKGQSVSAEVKADGSFEFAKVGPGTYQIVLDNKIRPKPSDVTIGEEDIIFRVEASFKPWVAGRVVFATQLRLRSFSTVSAVA